MTLKLSKSEFKAKVFEVLRTVERTGEPVVITERGVPIVEVRPYRGDACKAKDFLKGTVIRFDEPLDPAGEKLTALE